MEKTNELSCIMRLLNNYIDKEKEFYTKKINTKTFYYSIFEVSDENDTKELQWSLADFTKCKVEYIKVIDKIITTLESSGKYVKVLGVLRALQDDIARMNYSASVNEIESVKMNFAEYKRSLEMFEEIYENIYGKNLIDSEELKEIDVEIANLIQDINNSSIDETFKRAILRALLDVKYYIEKYSLYGVDGIQESLEKLTGGFILSIKDMSKGAEDECRLFKTIMSVISHVNEIVQMADNVVRFAPPIITHLLEQLK